MVSLNPLQAQDSSVEFETMLRLGEAFDEARKQSYTECRMLYEEVIRKEAFTDDRKALAKANEIKGDYYFLISEYLKADQYYQKAFTYLSVNTDKTWEALLMMKMGRMYTQLMRHEEALNYLYMARDYFMDQSQVYLHAQTEIFIGEYFRKIGDYNEALEHMTKAGKSGETLSGTEQDVLLMQYYNRLAAIYNETGQHKHTIEYSEKCIALCKEHNDLFYEASALNELGFVYEKTQEKNALEYYGKAAQLYESIGAYRYLAGTLVNTMRTEIKARQYQKALDISDRLKQLAEGKNWLIINKDIAEYETQIYLGLKDYAKALERHKRYHHFALEVVEHDRNARIMEIERRYDFKEKELLIENQKNQLRLNEEVIAQKEQNIRVIMLFGFLFILLSILLGVFYFSLRRQEQKLVKTNLRLEQSISEKEALVKEIHHRVKNNLNMLSGILLLEQNSIVDEQAKSILKDVQSRLETISLVHKQLLHPDENPVIKARAFFENFIDNIRDSVVDPNTRIHKQFNCHKEELPLNLAIPIALITNELITNSIKHARPVKGEALQISFVVNSNDDQLHLWVEDNGQGIKNHDLYKHAQTVGFKLITLLAKQIDADLEYSEEPQPRFSLRMNMSDHAKT